MTVRTHYKRLARLTLAFSKKLENFKAAIALHIAYYNFVKTHGSLRCSPAMAAGIEKSHWTIADLIKCSLKRSKNCKTPFAKRTAVIPATLNPFRLRNDMLVKLHGREQLKFSIWWAIQKRNALTLGAIETVIK